ncbi:MAG: hypothetical protein HC929_12080 [Leptolyngbyaceae cyanobacterium SM2_5_2]|nr:hypothetical protein [Leptolyngbyaceae cyanobacterium SM2_5_2]
MVGGVSPTNGTVSFATNANGPAAQQLVYTPNDDFDQLDSFTIQVSDGHGGFNTIRLCW